MNTEYVTQDLQSTIKNSIELHFNAACEDAAILRTKITTAAPGMLDGIYRDFKEHIDCIYLMAGDKKDLDNAVITDTKKFLLSRYSFKDKDIMYSLEVFEKFKNELFKKNMIMR